MNGRVNKPFHSSIPPKNGKWPHHTAPARLQKGENEFGCHGNCCCCQFHNMLWLCRTKCHYSSGTFPYCRSSFPQGAPVRKTGSSLPLVCPGSPGTGESKGMKPALLLLLTVFWDNVLWILNPLKTHKVSPGAEQRPSHCFPSANHLQWGATRSLHTSHCFS